MIIVVLSLALSAAPTTGASETEFSICVGLYSLGGCSILDNLFVPLFPSCEPPPNCLQIPKLPSNCEPLRGPKYAEA
jgi:hypothetical protein